MGHLSEVATLLSFELPTGGRRGVAEEVEKLLNLLLDLTPPWNPLLLDE
jgi:hypothetical protein